MPLPLPGTPSFSWAIYRERIKNIFNGADLRVCIAFWLFGLINNVLYVVILSAALDLVGTSIPKGLVLLFDITPSLIVKLMIPHFIHLVPYSTRILIFVSSSTIGMLLVALSSDRSVGYKMIGVILASSSSGAGESTFLGLTHYYGHFSLASWASGTGGAGVFGAAAYAIATNSLGMTVRSTLLASSFLPLMMFVCFFGILPREQLSYALSRRSEYESVESQDGESISPLLSQSPVLSTIGDSDPNSFENNFRRLKPLIYPFMLPLLIVYISEYTINQGVSPTLLFPLNSTPFREFREFYPTYNAIYQTGVIISRSSTPFIRIHQVYPLALLQFVNLVVLSLHGIFNFIPSVWIVFVIIFWEGLLGGSVYVNTFAELSDKIPSRDREWSLSTVSISDSTGIFIAAFLASGFEKFICNYQVSHGRDYCTHY